MDPVLGWVVVEGEQLVQVTGDLRGCLGELRAEQRGERIRRGACFLLVLGVPDLGQRLLRGGMRRLRHGAEDVGDFMEPAALLLDLGEHVAQRGPEAERAVAGRQHRGAQAAAHAVAHQVGPGFC